MGVNSRGTYVSSGIPGTGVYSRKYIASGAAATRATIAPAGPSQAPAPAFAIGPDIMSVPPELRGGQVAWGWAVLVGLMGFAWAPLFVAAAVLGVLAVATASSPKVRTARMVRRGLAAGLAGNWQAAVHDLGTAQQARPDLPRLRVLLGVALVGANRIEEAEPYLEAGYAALPVPALGSILAAVALGNNKADRAIEILQGLPPEAHLPTTINLLGKAFLALGQYQLAVEALKRGPIRKRDMTPKKLECHYLLGKAYLGLGERVKARREFERVAAADMNYCDVGALLAEAGGRQPTATQWGAATVRTPPQTGDGPHDSAV